MKQYESIVAITSHRYMLTFIPLESSYALLKASYAICQLQSSQLAKVPLVQYYSLLKGCKLKFYGFFIDAEQVKVEMNNTS